MINELQKLLYKLGCAAPILVTLGITLIYQNHNRIFCIIIILLGVILSLYTVVFVKLCEKKLPALEITVESISKGDREVYGYIVSYIAPVVGFVWDMNYMVWGIIVVGFVVLMYKVNSMECSPLLCLFNYHCYKVQLSTGISECIVISKKKSMRNGQQLKRVVRVDDMLLIDDERSE